MLSRLLALGDRSADDVRHVAAVLFFFLVLKQWLTARMEKDAVWWSRPFYRIVEASAALHGLLRGLLRFGLKRRPVPGAA